jgi:hypothetical protein
VTLFTSTELTYQIQNFHSFLWASGGCFSDYYTHQIDECSWMKGAWPVEAKAVGGHHYRGEYPVPEPGIKKDREY